MDDQNVHPLFCRCVYCISGRTIQPGDITNKQEHTKADPNQPPATKAKTKMNLLQLQSSTRASAILNLTHQLQGFKARYRNYEVDYTKLSLLCRRGLYGNANASSDQVREAALATFYLAAILQWAPTQFCFRGEKFHDAGGPLVLPARDQVEVLNDACPIWAAFFSDIIQADELLYQLLNELDPQDLGYEEVVLNLMHSKTTGDIDAKIAAVQECFKSADTKTKWVEKLFAVVQKKESIVTPLSYEQPLTEALVYGGWNRFCWRIMQGVDLETAVRVLLPQVLPPKLEAAYELGTTLPIELQQSLSQRLWFDWTSPRRSVEPWWNVVEDGE